MVLTPEMLRCYVSKFLASRFRARPAPLDVPGMERFPAAVLFADISGFTPLAERLAQRGPAGAEDLSGRDQRSLMVVAEAAPEWSFWVLSHAMVLADGGSPDVIVSSFRISEHQWRLMQPPGVTVSNRRCYASPLQP